MVTLVVEDGTGLANANAYISRADATTFFGEHLYATDWTGATDANKDIALTMSTRLLDDSFRWKGKKKTTTQALEWPRFDIHDRDGWYQSDIPGVIGEATAEFAKWLLLADRTSETGDLGFEELKAGSLFLKIKDTDRRRLIPSIVVNMLGEYAELFGGSTRKVTR